MNRILDILFAIWVLSYAYNFSDVYGTVMITIRDNG